MNKGNALWGLALIACLALLPQNTWAHGSPNEREWEKRKYLGWEAKWGAGERDYWHADEPVVRYNRVEGLYIGLLEPRSYRRDRGLATYGQLGYSFGAEDWQYQIGAEVFSFHRSPQTGLNLSSIGGELHDLTATEDDWLLDVDENTVMSGLFRRDFFDYYRRRGGSLYTIQNIGGLVHLTGRLAQDEFLGLDPQVDWVLFGNRLARSDFRPNPGIDEGRAHTLRLDIQLDTRDRRHRPQEGWLVNQLFERGGGGLGGDFTFRRFLVDVRRYQPLTEGGGQLDLRLRLGRGAEEMPRQYLFDLGGYSTMRGYSYKAFTGDRMVLFNAEYWLDDVGVLFDVGSAWFSSAGGQRALDRGETELATEAKFRKSLGFAARLDEGFHFGLARPLDGADEDWRYFASFSRTF